MTFSDTARKSPQRMRKYAEALQMRINRTEEEDVDPEAAAANIWLAIDACRMMINEAQGLQAEFISKLPMVQTNYAEWFESQNGGGELEALKFAKSVIKSGEAWSAECEKIIDGAIKKAEGNHG